MLVYDKAQRLEPTLKEAIQDKNTGNVSGFRYWFKLPEQGRLIVKVQENSLWEGKDGTHALPLPARKYSSGKLVSNKDDDYWVIAKSQ
ncbi:hypothetical protein [Pseudoalteromonas denitrificans]|uniref:Uncharacterized protein n=1 Tax=Pseudoalteromonas denitrificans DSM 6059 TaxID=1123010 RepID=A0A1I1NEA0_9GAMM|nr:hypothetical protein [Pseudoalteromonas denitrificans]SFC96044.1 hypothetical protein SAMN02745724_03047 [Pseudoalteromonas denitrificans DSM 6059]